MLAPAGILYLSFVLAVTASGTPSSQPAYFRLSTLSTIALVLFVPAQLVGARYLQRLLPPRPTKTGKWMQYLIALFTGALFSICAAMILVALGLNVLARARH